MPGSEPSPDSRAEGRRIFCLGVEILWSFDVFVFFLASGTPHQRRELDGDRARPGSPVITGSSPADPFNGRVSRPATTTRMPATRIARRRNQPRVIMPHILHRRGVV